MAQLKLGQVERTHVAIMRKSWGLTQKLLTGEKTIESRWYKNRYPPWGKINLGDTVYFKDSGEPVTIKAVVGKVFSFENLTPDKVERILKEYGRVGGLGIDTKELGKYYQMFKDKRYCLIIFLKDIKKVKSFEIDKTGFGAMAAWLTVDDIKKIEKK